MGKGEENAPRLRRMLRFFLLVSEQIMNVQYLFVRLVGAIGQFMIILYVLDESIGGFLVNYFIMLGILFPLSIIFGFVTQSIGWKMKSTLIGGGILGVATSLTCFLGMYGPIFWLAYLASMAFYCTFTMATQRVMTGKWSLNALH